MQDSRLPPVVELFADSVVVDAFARTIGCRGNGALPSAPLDHLRVEMVLRHGSPAACALLCGLVHMWTISAEGTVRRCQGAEPLMLGVPGEQGSPGDWSRAGWPWRASKPRRVGPGPWAGKLGVSREQGSLTLGTGSKAPGRTQTHRVCISAPFPSVGTPFLRHGGSAPGCLAQPVFAAIIPLKSLPLSKWQRFQRSLLSRQLNRGLS